MKINLLLNNLVAVSLILFSAASISYANEIKESNQQITVCYEDRDYPPYVYAKSDNKSDVGLLVDIVIRAAEKTGVAIELIRRPWSRCQMLVNENKADALFAMIKTPERIQLFAFPEDHTYSLLKVNYPIFFQKNGEFDNAQTLIGLGNGELNFNVDYYQKKKLYGLSAPLGYVVYQYIHDNQIASSYDYTLDDGMHAVAIGRLDGYIVERLIGQHYLSTHSLEDSVFSSDVIVKRDDWYIPFSNEFYLNNTELVKVFWRNIQIARDEVLSSSSLP
jgi:polar amino acid transport system substrate-binding protein